MGRPAGWITTLTGRTAMRSPGRPPIGRGVEWEFWVRIAEGMSSEEAGIACGVSGVVGSRWFREGGGMPTLRLGPRAGTCPSPNARRSRCCGLRLPGCGRSRASWAGRPRRSRESCGATPPPAGPGWTIGPRSPSGRPSWRLGVPKRRLVAAGSGAHALTAVGWDGPLNLYNDTAKFSAIVTSWEQRFGVRVVAVGPATLHLCVAAPPTSTEGALRVAAEHFAFCPDNIWQGHRSNTLSAYAERLVHNHRWDFWWD